MFRNFKLRGWPAWQLLAGVLTIMTFSQSPCTQALEFSVPRGIYLASYTELETVSTSENIVDVGCTDSEGVPLSNATYAILQGDTAPFTIEEDSGQISWGQTFTLDYEAKPFYLFTISCVDDLDPSDVPITATATVNVSVLPVNEFLPQIRPGVLTVFVGENTPQGTILVSTQPGHPAQYTVTDRDDGPDGVIKYSFPNTSDSLGGIFSVDRETGELSLARPLDVDNIPSASDFITVRITACDTTPRDQCPNIPITIIVISAADNDPMFAEENKIVSVSEDTAAGTVIATSMCTDRDIGRGAYEGMNIHNVIPSTAEDFFRLDIPEDGNGDLVLVQPLDYEVARIYNITLRCFDNQNDPIEDFARVFITVRPINDEPPVFGQSIYSFAVNRISASGVDIGRVEAMDRDQEVGGEITYSIISGDESNFGLRLDGMVYLNDFVFAFEGDTFPLVVMASDGIFNDTTEVIITVSGFLSIPEIVVIVLSALLFIIIVVVFVVIICGCCCFRCFSSNKETPSMSDLKFDMTDGHHKLDYVEPRYIAPVAGMPMGVYPLQYEPVQSRAPTSVFQNWGVTMQESPSESENEEVDHSTSPQSNIGPVLQEVVEHFKEGDKMITKTKKDSRSEK